MLNKIMLIGNLGRDPELNVTQEVPIGIRFADGRMDWNVTQSVRAFYRFHHDWNLATSGSPVSPFQTGRFVLSRRSR